MTNEKKNVKVRSAMKEANVKQWELADLMGIAETTLCKWMRKELPEDLQAKMLQLIEDNAKVRA